MASYLLIESRDTFRTGEVAFCHDLARRLAAAGDRVTLFLVQNGVVRTEGEHFSETFPLNGKTCTFQSNFQYANGEVRYSNFQSGWY